MIHRFLDLPAPVVTATAPIVPLMVTIGAGTDTTEVWVIGGGFTPAMAATQTATGTGGSHIGDPRLSPNESEIIYSYVPGGTAPNSGRIRICAVDGSSDAQVVTGIFAYTSSITSSPCWSPSGAEIAWVDPPSTSGGEWLVRKANADGSSPTTLYTLNTDLTGVTMKGLSWSPSGDYLSVLAVKNPSGADRIIVVNADGTGGSVIVTGPSGGGNDGSSVSPPAWKRDGSDVLGFSNAPTSGDYTFKTINADGTGVTTIYTDTSRIYFGVERLSWLSDDSALVAAKAVSGRWELATIDGAGGGPTDSGIDLSDTNQPFKQPFVMVTTQEAPRIYYTTEASGGGLRTVSSVLEDFTDVRVDWDQNDYSAVTDHHGVFDYDVN